MSRTTTPPIERWSTWFSAAFPVLLLVVIVATFRDYGITWDEEAQSSYGRHLLRWYGSLFQDDSALHFSNLYYYGGLFETVAELAASLTPESPFETRHLVNAMAGLLAVVGAERIGTHLAGPLGGALSAVFLVLTPLFYGHLFNNPKDVPFAAAWTLALWALLWSWDQLPRLSLARVAVTGAALGTTLGIRAAGLGLIVNLFLLGAAWLAGAPAAGFHRKAALRPLLASMAKIVAVAWGLMLVAWPWAAAHPLSGPFAALQAQLALNARAVTLFAGRIVAAADAPRSYVPLWFSVTLPELYLLAAVAGGATLLRALSTAGRPVPLEPRTRRLKLVWLAWTAAAPLVAAVVMRPYLYDGLRHFLFVLPTLAVLTTADFLRSTFSRSVRALVGAAMLSAAVLTTVDMIRLHPYQSVYFNRLVAGGVARASERFETDYWGSSYKEGTEWLIDHYALGIARKVRVFSTSVPLQSEYYLTRSPEGRRRFLYVPLDREPHVVLATTRKELHKTFPGRVVHVVERLGAKLLYVIETRQPLTGFFHPPRADDPRIVVPAKDNQP